MLRQFKNPNLYLMLGLDLVIFALSMPAAHFIRFEFVLKPTQWTTVLHLVWLSMGVKIFVFAGFGMHRGMWRYTDIQDSWRLLQACVTASLIMVAVCAYWNRFQGLSRSVFVIDAILTFILAGGLRVSIRTFFRHKDRLQGRIFLSREEYRLRRQKLKTVLIVGAGKAGEMLCREIIENPSLAYQIAGFVDDDPQKQGRRVHGIPVLGRIDELGQVAARVAPDLIFLALPSVSGVRMREIVARCEKTGVAFKTLPSLGELMDGRVSVRQLREVNFQDLLGRDPVHLDHPSIERYLHDQTVLVSGAGGSIGSELCRQIVRFCPGRIILVDSSEVNLYSIDIELCQELGFAHGVPVLGSIGDKALMDRVFSRWKPQVVFHAAAYKHVPMLEANPWQAVFNNVQGSNVLMKSAAKHKVERFVVVSTDKAVRPTNVMGASKRVTELLMRLYNGNKTKFMAVRFGNVVGSSGSVIPLFKRQIARGGPVTVTHPEMTRFFMTIEEAAQLILQAGALGKGGEVFILDMGTPVKIYDMAKDLIRLMGKEPETDIEISFVGLRPGEKLFEELITQGEGIVPAGHEKIMVLGPDKDSVVNRSDFTPWLEGGLEELIRGAEDRDGQRIRQALVRLVAEYNPKGKGDVFEQK